MPNPSIYYKYRSLENFKFFIDIIVNNRLYAAKYSELNDIREGIYSHDSTLDEITIEQIKEIKNNTRTCSLSKIHNNQPMWAHYANNHTGIVIKLKIIDQDTEIEPVKYGTIKKGNTQNDTANQNMLVQDILTYKEKVWNYEKEVRVFKTVTDIEPMAFVNIEIVGIILGKRVSKDDENLIREIIKKLGLMNKIRIKKYGERES